MILYHYSEVDSHVEMTPCGQRRRFRQWRLPVLSFVRKGRKRETAKTGESRRAVVKLNSTRHKNSTQLFTEKNFDKPMRPEAGT